MTNKLSRVTFKVGDVRYLVQGAKWFYNDADIRSKTGADLTSESDLTANNTFDQKTVIQRKLVRLAMTLSNDRVGVNAAQTKTTRRYFWCHPAKVYTAMKDLPGKNIDPSLFPGSYRIVKVEMPVDSNLR